MNKHLSAIATISVLAFSNSALADCGGLPQFPSLLSETQLTQSELGYLQNDMESFKSSLDTYMYCLDEQIASISNENEDPAYYDSPEYQALFDQHMQLVETANQHKKLAKERANYLSANPLPENTQN